MNWGLGNYAYNNNYNMNPVAIGDKYGYNRGLTVPYAFDRSNQFLAATFNSTDGFRNVASERASIMRQYGTAAIEDAYPGNFWGNGGPGLYGLNYWGNNNGGALASWSQMGAY